MLLAPYGAERLLAPIVTSVTLVQTVLLSFYIAPCVTIATLAPPVSGGLLGIARSLRTVMGHTADIAFHWLLGYHSLTIFGGHTAGATRSNLEPRAGARERR